MLHEHLITIFCRVDKKNLENKEFSQPNATSASIMCESLNPEGFGLCYIFFGVVRCGAIKDWIKNVVQM